MRRRVAAAVEVASKETQAEVVEMFIAWRGGVAGAAQALLNQREEVHSGHNDGSCSGSAALLIGASGLWHGSSHHHASHI